MSDPNKILGKIRPALIPVVEPAPIIDQVTLGVGSAANADGPIDFATAISTVSIISASFEIQVGKAAEKIAGFATANSSYDSAIKSFLNLNNTTPLNKATFKTAIITALDNSETIGKLEEYLADLDEALKVQSLPVATTSPFYPFELYKSDVTYGKGTALRAYNGKLCVDIIGVSDQATVSVDQFTGNPTIEDLNNGWKLVFDQKTSSFKVQDTTTSNIFSITDQATTATHGAAIIDAHGTIIPDAAHATTANVMVNATDVVFSDFDIDGKNRTVAIHKQAAPVPSNELIVRTIRANQDQQTITINHISNGSTLTLDSVDNIEYKDATSKVTIGLPVAGNIKIDNPAACQRQADGKKHCSVVTVKEYFPQLAITLNTEIVTLTGNSKTLFFLKDGTFKVIGSAESLTEVTAATALLIKQADDAVKEFTVPTSLVSGAEASCQAANAAKSIVDGYVQQFPTASSNAIGDVATQAMKACAAKDTVKTDLIGVNNALALTTAAAIAAKAAAIKREEAIGENPPNTNKALAESIIAKTKIVEATQAAGSATGFAVDAKAQVVTASTAATQATNDVVIVSTAIVNQAKDAVQASYDAAVLLKTAGEAAWGTDDNPPDDVNYSFAKLTTTGRAKIQDAIAQVAKINGAVVQAAVDKARWATGATPPSITEALGLIADAAAQLKIAQDATVALTTDIASIKQIGATEAQAATDANQAKIPDEHNVIMTMADAGGSTTTTTTSSVNVRPNLITLKKLESSGDTTILRLGTTGSEIKSTVDDVTGKFVITDLANYWALGVDIVAGIYNLTNTAIDPVRTYYITNNNTNLEGAISSTGFRITTPNVDTESESITITKKSGSPEGMKIISTKVGAQTQTQTLDINNLSDQSKIVMTNPGGVALLDKFTGLELIASPYNVTIIDIVPGTTNVKTVINKRIIDNPGSNEFTVNFNRISFNDTSANSVTLNNKLTGRVVTVGPQNAFSVIDPKNPSNSVKPSEMSFDEAGNAVITTVLSEATIAPHEVVIKNVQDGSNKDKTITVTNIVSSTSISAIEETGAILIDGKYWSAVIRQDTGLFTLKHKITAKTYTLTDSNTDLKLVFSDDSSDKISLEDSVSKRIITIDQDNKLFIKDTTAAKGPLVISSAGENGISNKSDIKVNSVAPTATFDPAIGTISVTDAATQKTLTVTPPQDPAKMIAITDPQTGNKMMVTKVQAIAALEITISNENVLFTNSVSGSKFTAANGKITTQNAEVSASATSSEPDANGYYGQYVLKNAGNNQMITIIDPSKTLYNVAKTGGVDIQDNYGTSVKSDSDSGFKILNTQYLKEDILLTAKNINATLYANYAEFANGGTKISNLALYKSLLAASDALLSPINTSAAIEAINSLPVVNANSPFKAAIDKLQGLVFDSAATSTPVQINTALDLVKPILESVHITILDKLGYITDINSVTKSFKVSKADDVLTVENIPAGQLEVKPDANGSVKIKFPTVGVSAAVALHDSIFTFGDIFTITNESIDQTTSFDATTLKYSMRDSTHRVIVSSNDVNSGEIKLSDTNNTKSFVLINNHLDLTIPNEGTGKFLLNIDATKNIIFDVTSDNLVFNNGDQAFTFTQSGDQTTELVVTNTAANLFKLSGGNLEVPITVDMTEDYTKVTLKGTDGTVVQLNESGNGLLVNSKGTGVFEIQDEGHPAPTQVTVGANKITLDEKFFTTFGANDLQLKYIGDKLAITTIGDNKSSVTVNTVNGAQKLLFSSGNGRKLQVDDTDAEVIVKVDATTGKAASFVLNEPTSKSKITWPIEFKPTITLEDSDGNVVDMDIDSNQTLLVSNVANNSTDLSVSGTSGGLENNAVSLKAGIVTLTKTNVKLSIYTHSEAEARLKVTTDSTIRSNKVFKVGYSGGAVNNIVKLLDGKIIFSNGQRTVETDDVITNLKVNLGQTDGTYDKTFVLTNKLGQEAKVDLKTDPSLSQITLKGEDGKTFIFEDKNPNLTITGGTTAFQIRDPWLGTKPYVGIDKSDVVLGDGSNQVKLHINSEVPITVSVAADNSKFIAGSSTSGGKNKVSIVAGDLLFTNSHSNLKLATLNAITLSLSIPENKQDNFIFTDNGGTTNLEIALPLAASNTTNLRVFNNVNHSYVIAVPDSLQMSLEKTVGFKLILSKSSSTDTYGTSYVTFDTQASDKNIQLYTSGYLDPVLTPTLSILNKKFYVTFTTTAIKFNDIAHYGNGTKNIELSIEAPLLYQAGVGGSNVMIGYGTVTQEVRADVKCIENLLINGLDPFGNITVIGSCTGTDQEKAANYELTP
jgi:hypothetical protein